LTIRVPPLHVDFEVDPTSPEAIVCAGRIGTP
jgi:hypothetical protein